jgi:LPXTG-site transpeptidase (sortase) family protein
LADSARIGGLGAPPSVGAPLVPPNPPGDGGGGDDAGLARWVRGLPVHPNASELPAAPGLTPVPAPSAALEPPARPGRSPAPSDGGAGRVRTAPARLADLASSPLAAVPVRVRIPRIAADLPVVPVGVEASGEMEIPTDVRTAGWYRYGPAPGEAGSAVVTAHVDSRSQGPGPFQRLHELRPGDRVEVEQADGGVLAFAVQGRTRVLKEELPLGTVFRRDGGPALTLITCGGDFDEAAARYDENVVVVAVPMQPDGREPAAARSVAG